VTTPRKTALESIAIAMAGFTAFLGVYNTSMQAMAFAVREA